MEEIPEVRTQIPGEIGQGLGINNMNDPLGLSNSDHPGAQLVANVFNGSNYLSWSRGVKMALGAKYKIAFIDGSSKPEDVPVLDLPRWKRCDYMVRCWILNSIAPQLLEGLMYAESAQQLWDDLAERYAQKNGPLLYQLRKLLSNLAQGSMSLAEYFNKMKKLWDEILNLKGVPKCSCGALKRCTCDVIKKITEIDNYNKLLQFLMGLNDNYESVRNQILAMDVTPAINKAYYLVYQIEIAGGEGTSTGSSQDSNAFLVNKSAGVKKGNKKEKTDKSDKLCTHCEMQGHTIELFNFFYGKKN